MGALMLVSALAVTATAQSPSRSPAGSPTTGPAIVVVAREQSFGGLPTSDWWRMLESEPALLHGIVKTDRLIVFGGGVPLVADGRTIGAIGVSGGSSEEDVQIAEAGAAVVS